MEDELALLPVQLIELDDGVVVKRGLEQLLITDDSVLAVLQVLQREFSSGPATELALLALFAAPVRPLVAELIKHLRRKRFLVPLAQASTKRPAERESAQDIFYWHFNLCQEQVAESLDEKSWLFVGINKLTWRLLSAMREEGLTNYWIVDDPTLRDIDHFDDQHRLVPVHWRDLQSRILGESAVLTQSQAPRDVGFVVAASEFGSFYLLERWNAYAVERKHLFYPCVLQNIVGYAGPLVVPGETACFACLKARQNSRSDAFGEKRVTERHAFQGQKVAAYHRSMLDVLAAVAQFDLVKFKSGIQWELGTLCEIDLLGGRMSRRKLLKAPRCPVCSTTSAAPQLNVRKQLTSSEAWDDIRQTVGYAQT